MGLADRDYMRDRQRKHDAKTINVFTTAKESSATSTLYAVLVWVAIFLLLFKVFRSWEESHKEQVRPPVQGSSHTEMQAPPASVKEPPQTRERQVSGGAVASQAPTVTKCTTQNGTTYSDVPCAAGAKSTSVKLQPNVNVSDAPVRHSIRPAPAVAYTATVSPSSVVAAAEKYDPRLAECDTLTADLHHWDERARQPLSGQMQDWIRDKQRALRARKFELRC